MPRVDAFAKYFCILPRYRKFSCVALPSSALRVSLRTCGVLLLPSVPLCMRSRLHACPGVGRGPPRKKVRLSTLAASCPAAGADSSVQLRTYSLTKWPVCCRCHSPAHSACSSCHGAPSPLPLHPLTARCGCLCTGGQQEAQDLVGCDGTRACAAPTPPPAYLPLLQRSACAQLRSGPVTRVLPSPHPLPRGVNEVTQRFMRLSSPGLSSLEAICGVFKKE